MKFSVFWLRELINLEIDLDKLAEQLTMVGLEVASMTPVAKDFSGVVIGQILEVNRHPNADKLTVCTVNVGEAEPLIIVCGAANVRSGLKVPVATIGAKLPNSFIIKQTKLRGVDSCGMMCSAAELGLVQSGSGLLELPDDAPIGNNLREYLLLDDSKMEIELTPDRGDCLSILGIAREIAAINKLKIKPIENPKFVVSGSVFPVVITAKEACPHYVGRVIRGIDNQVSTPIWIKERLARSDINSINLVVDIANYVMLELGQPLHAFDLAKLDQEIQVRYATKKEDLTLLDGNKVKLNPNTLVIADRSKVLAIAGVMGGEDSGVNVNTTDIFLESAFFTPEKIAGVARNYGLQTDASYRFERGVDYTLQLQALNRTTALLLEIAGGKPSDVSEIIIPGKMPQGVIIDLQCNNIKKVLGIDITDHEVFSILAYLGMKVEVTDKGWQVCVPTWRFDLEIEEDLIEEIARIYGYHNIPEQKIIAQLISPLGASSQVNKNDLYALIISLGYSEIITYSFVDPKLQSLLNPEYTGPTLLNPISPELSVMRTTLMPGLLEAVRYNIHRQQQRLRFFEMGLCFLQQGDVLEQPLMLGGISLGTVYPEQWGIKQKEQVDFFDLKSDVENILKQMGYFGGVEYRTTTHPAFHPKRSALIYVENILIGIIGELHPKIKIELDLNKKACIFEINLSNIFNKLRNKFKEFSRFPKIQRDIALIVAKDITWQRIKQKIVDNGGELLHNIELFDIYGGSGIDQNKKSMAIHLDFQSVDRTLVDTEIDVLVNKIVSVLKQTFDASLRG